jgi:hypothetical protein
LQNGLPGVIVKLCIIRKSAIPAASGSISSNF